MKRTPVKSSGARAARVRAGKLVRPSVLKLHAYVPGEQPKIKGLIKLNTNENPYPPSPKVLAAIKRPSMGAFGCIRIPPRNRCGRNWPSGIGARQTT